MKVAIVHDWLTGFRGGERVLEAICELYPEAEIYTLFHKIGSTSKFLESRKIHTTFLNFIPGIHTHYRNYLPLFPLAISTLKLPLDTELVISSSHCVAKAVKKSSEAKHICYIHSPMRYIYDQFDSYFGKETLLKKTVGHCIRPFLQNWDSISNVGVDRFIANSSFVADRVRSFYFRSSQVIHPFVDLKDFRSHQKNPPAKKDFFLMVTAFAPNKRVDLAVAAFKKLDLKLKIVGPGQVETEQLSGGVNNVEFLGHLPREEVVKLMFEARGFVFPGTEDFGITPLESLAAGTPVIAYFGGGVLETLTSETAKFFFDQDVNSLVEALRNFRLEDYDKLALYQRAEQFSKEKFQQEIKNYISRCMDRSSERADN